MTMISPEFEVYLIDESSAKYVDLRDNSTYTFTPYTSISKFIVIVGKAGEIADKLAAVAPKDFLLEDNFPNPFNSSTTIRYAIPQTGPVYMRIYDQTGKWVKTLINEFMTAGEHEIVWDAKDDAGIDVASGVYFYQLSTSTHTMTKKIILTR